jgi:K+-transporting ATPase ATPase C chain
MPLRLCKKKQNVPKEFAMWKTLGIALRLAAVTLALTGVAYPMAITGLALALFPRTANGSLITGPDGRVVGSELIGQSFHDPGYFQPRPSAAGAGYDAANSSGSNLGPTSARLRARVTAELDRLRGENPEASGPVPSDLVTASASGLDPDISVEAAMWQVPRVARARRVVPERVRALVLAGTRERQLGVLGERRVNVLLLNLALDRGDL